MQKFGLIIDSTVYFDEDTFKNIDFEVVSLSVTVDEMTYQEVEINEELLYPYIDEGTRMNSSAPSVGAFVEAYEAAIEKGYTKIAVIPLSSGLSSTYQSAVMAADLLDRPDIDIRVIDTLSANLGIRNLLLTLTDDIASGMDIDEFEKEILKRAEQSKLQFTLTHLRQLLNTGRLRKLTYYAAGILRIKPLIELVDGKLENVARPRSKRSVIRNFINSIGSIVKLGKLLRITVIALNEEAALEELLRQIKAEFPHATIDVIHKINPVFTLSIGYKGIGFAATAY